jgi:hypothetical protein
MGMEMEMCWDWEFKVVDGWMGDCWKRGKIVGDLVEARIELKVSSGIRSL